MGNLLQDLRYGFRMLAKNRGFTAIAVLTLALGIGANTALFSVVNGVLLNPLHFAQPDRLVALYSRTKQFTRSSISYPNFLDWVRDNQTFSALAAYRGDDFSLTGMGEPQRLPVEMVSATFFPVLGVRPAMGRTFLPDEDRVGARPVALISAGLWNRKFAASADAIGKTLTLNGDDYTIIGVIPPDFRYTGNNFHRSDVYVPIGQWKDPSFRDRRLGMGMDAVGRLKPGVTIQQAKADMDALGKHLAEAFPDVDKDTGITLIPLKQNVVGDIQPFLLVLLASVGFVLLIACVNVANLLLARSTGRAREFAIRAALGASRGRVMVQLLTESILLALAGGGLGLLMASWGLQAALKILPEALPRAEEIHLDARVLVFTLAASMLAGILFGLAPALKTSHIDLHETLKEGGRGLSGVHHRAQSVFVVVEMALALVLLAGAGLMLRSLAKLWSVNPGFDPHNVVTLYTSFPPIKSPDALRATWRQMYDTVSSIPGVTAASITVASRPMGSDSDLPFWIDGQPKPSSQAEMKVSLFYLVQSDYLRAMGTPLERGRFLTPQDNEHAPNVIVIDERFARLYFPNQNPVGRRVNIDVMNTTAEIVGVVGHVKQWGLDEDAHSPVLAQCYIPISQTPDRLLSLMAGTVGVVARTSGSPLAQVSSIRRALEKVNGQAVTFGVQTMDEVISDSLAAQRFSMILLGIFAGLALIMSCVGIYGVISYVAGQRTHEIGIRMALGAERRDVLRLVIGQGAKMALVGVGIGLVASLGLTRLMSKMLFGVSAHDPLTLAVVGGLLALVALAACYIPARRATKVDPMVALRYE
ncbi:MAG TPA: ABC transporter permease [Terriglobia bacterium]|nr:ABC transporter permease [Terriglobia bacterium]